MTALREAMMTSCERVARCAARDGEPAEEARRKSLLLPSCIVLSPVLAAAALIEWGAAGPSVAGGATLAAAAGCAAFAARVLLSRQLPLSGAAALLATLLATALAADWGAAGGGAAEAWPCGLVAADVLVLLGAPRSISQGCFYAVAAWVALRGVDACVGLGVWSYPHGTHGAAALPAALCVRLLPVLVALCFTQHIVRSVRNTVTFSQVVAEALVRYDLQTAADALFSQEAEGLPPQLRRAYEELISNFATYKSYLPQSVLPEAQGCADPMSLLRPPTGESPRHGATPQRDSPHSAGAEDLRLPTMTMTAPSMTMGGMVIDAELFMPMRSFTGQTMQAGQTMRPLSPRAEGVPQVNSRVFTPTKETMTILSFNSGNRQQKGTEASRLIAHGSQFSRVTSSGQRIPLAAVPRTNVVTLLASNRTGFLAAAERQSAADVTLWLSIEVDHLAQTVLEFKGCVDVFAADHALSSFAAVRPCAEHRQAAVRAALRLRDDGVLRVEQENSCPLFAALGRTSAACSGHALIGDFGSPAARRFMILGTLSSMIAVTERLAAVWHAGVLIDDPVHAEAERLWQCRLYEQVTYRKRGPEPQFLWTVVDVEEGTVCGGGHRSKANVWDTFNDAMLCHLSGNVDEAARRIALCGPAIHSNKELRDALILLRARIAESAPPCLTVNEVVVARTDVVNDPPPQANGDGDGKRISVGGMLVEGRRVEEAMAKVREEEREQQLRNTEEKKREKREQRAQRRSRLGSGGEGGSLSPADEDVEGGGEAPREAGEEKAGARVEERVGPRAAPRPAALSMDDVDGDDAWRLDGGAGASPRLSASDCRPPVSPLDGNNRLKRMRPSQVEVPDPVPGSKS